MLLQLTLRKSRSWMFSKNVCTQEQPLRCTFQACCSELEVKFFRKYLWLSANFGEFAFNAFLLFTTDAEELYLIATFCWTTLFKGTLSKGASVFWKSGKTFMETSGIIRKIPSCSLQETCARSLIFWRNHCTKNEVFH